MIAMIEYEKYNYKTNLPSTKYEFVDCQNIDDVKLAYKHDQRKINYIGKILKQSQIENLHYYGNTVIPYTMLDKLGDEKIIKEIKQLTNLNCNISITDSGSVIINVLTY